MSDLIFVELNKKKVGKQKLVKYQVLRQSKKSKKYLKMEEDDYRELLEVIQDKTNQLSKKSKASFKFAVRADTEEGWKTIKGYNNSGLDDYLEYYEDRTKEGAKFYKTFDQFEIQIKFSI